MKLFILIGLAVILLNTILCLCCVHIAAVSDYQEADVNGREDI